MTAINTATALRLGSQTVDAVYAGSIKVWKFPALTMTGTPVTTADEYEHGVGSTYTGFTVTASGGIPPYTYSATGLPAGFTIDVSTGAVSGTPGFESAGIYSNIIIQAFDSLGAAGQLAPFTLTINYKDPYYNDVKLLLDTEGVANDFLFVDKKFGIAGFTGGDAKYAAGGSFPPPYGLSYISLDGNGDYIRFADDPKWDLLAAPFTIDFTAWPTSIANNSVTFFIGQFGANAPNLSWVFYLSNAGQVQFNVSTTGSDNLNPISAPFGTIVGLVWVRWRLDYDGTNYRIYKDGTMVAKATATHTKAQVAQPLVIGANSSVNSWFYQGYIKGVRLTVGTARTASDSGYTISNRQFPFVPVVPTTAKFDASTAFNVAVGDSGLSISNLVASPTVCGIRAASASAKTTGKYYYEVQLLSHQSGSVGLGGVGIITSSFVNMQNNAATGVMLQSTGGQIWAAGTMPALLGGRATGDIIGFAIDLDNRKFWCREVRFASNWNGIATDNPATNTGGVAIPAGGMVPLMTFGTVFATPANKIITNFGASPFTISAVPVGFTAGWPV